MASPLLQRLVRCAWRVFAPVGNRHSAVTRDTLYGTIKRASCLRERMEVCGAKSHSLRDYSLVLRESNCKCNNGVFVDKNLVHNKRKLGIRN